MNIATQIRDRLEASQAEMVALLEKLVRMESPTDVPATQQPVLNELQQQFHAMGYRTLRLPARKFGGCLYARPKTSERQPQTSLPCQLLLGHCDTVWPVGTLQTMPLLHEGDSIKGPGIYDMKAGLVEILFALRTLEALQLKPSVEPVVFINSDEELGSRESTRYIKALAKIADRALVMEPSIGYRGKLKTARKGVGKFTVKIKGKAAHAGLDPTAGASAILELSHVIQKLFALNDPVRGASVNVGVIDGGVRANVVAPESSAIVDVRVANREDAERIEQAIRNLQADTPGVTLEIEGRIGRPPMDHTPANRQLWHVATELADQLELSLDEATAGGGSDGNTTSQYTATLDGLGAVGDGAHASHEHILANQLPGRAALLAMLLLAPALKDIAKSKDKQTALNNQEEASS